MLEGLCKWLVIDEIYFFLLIDDLIIDVLVGILSCFLYFWNK